MALPIVMKKAEERMRQHANQFGEQPRPQRNEGEVTIEGGSKNSDRKSKEDYVDYVEIKD